jgi:hypothetical protein
MLVAYRKTLDFELKDRFSPPRGHAKARKTAAIYAIALAGMPTSMNQEFPGASPQSASRAGSISDSPGEVTVSASV